MKPEVSEFLDGLYILDDGHVRAFLIPDQQESLLIDTAFAESGIVDAAKQLASGPIKVIATHADPDHTDGIKALDRAECHIHADEMYRLDDGVTAHEIKEGDRITAGDYTFEVIHMPGHTFGNIALFDEVKGLLISADSIQENNPIFMFGEHRDLPLYIQSLEKIALRKEQIRTIIPSHGPYPLGNEMIAACLEAACELRAGNLTGTPHEKFPCKHYVYENVQFFY